MEKIKIGLLPLYIKLYDDTWPEFRRRVDPFYEAVRSALAEKGLDVIASPVCRVKAEFESAIRRFEQAEADAIVTLHLAYSPSLESSEALAATKLPVIVLDTTPAFEFSPETDPDELNYNHGIHGVQDMCHLLVRHGKPFFIEAGHWRESDVLGRVASRARSAGLAKAMRNARVGIVGTPFAGMGDFDVPEDILRSKLGMRTVKWDAGMAGSFIGSVKEADIATEMAADRARFDASGLDAAVHRRATVAGLAVRRWLDKNELTAFTVSFLSIGRETGLPCMPFLEASKAMARGIGYAGEGDMLTASLVGSLLAAYPETSFAEMFCPDWKHGSIFLSHMGEMNIDLATGTPRLMEKAFPFTDAGNTAAAYGRFKEGRVTLADLAPAANGTFSLLLAPGHMLGVTGGDSMVGSVHGWFRPGISIEDFLSAYSGAGGTHHLALVYGAAEREIEGFGRLMGWDVLTIA